MHCAFESRSNIDRFALCASSKSCAKKLQFKTKVLSVSYSVYFFFFNFLQKEERKVYPSVLRGNILRARLHITSNLFIYT